MKPFAILLLFGISLCWIGSMGFLSPKVGAARSPEATRVSARVLSKNQNLPLRGFPTAEREWSSEQLLESADSLAQKSADQPETLASMIDPSSTLSFRRVVCQALVKIGSEASIQEFYSLVATELDPDAKTQMMSELIALSKPEATGLLVSVIAQTSDPIVLQETANTLQRMADSNAVIALSELALQKNEENLPAKERALKIISGLSSAAAEPELRSLIAVNPDQPDLRRSALHALSQVASENEDGTPLSPPENLTTSELLSWELWIQSQQEQYPTSF